MSGTPYRPSVVVSGDEDLNELFQKVLNGFSPTPITPDSAATSMETDAGIEVSPLAKRSTNRTFFFIQVDRSWLTQRDFR